MVAVVTVEYLREGEKGEEMKGAWWCLVERARDTGALVGVIGAVG